MTCIIGLTHEGKAYVGADSATVAGQLVRVTNLPKVFKNGKFIIGYTGSFRMGQILQHHLSVRGQYEDETDDVYMVRAFAEAVRDILKDKGYAKVDNNVESGGFFIVAYKGHVYDIDNDFQVNEMADGFSATGCGEHFALAALKAFEDLPPKERILKALEITAYFSGYVIPPFHVLGENDTS